MDDIDIYADLPSFNLDLEKNDKPCNCEELKKDLTSLTSKFENIQKIKDNLENNLSSLLKTARAEIARKDKIIDDLRKRLDDTTFRRNIKNESMSFSAHKSHQQHIMIKKYENIPSMHSQESETVLHQTELYHNEHINKKSQNDIDRISTVFGERLHKRIMEDEKEGRKQRASLKLSEEVNAKEVPEENIVESDKENGSQSTTINSGNEFNIITQHSSSETSYKKTLGKRVNENEDKHGNKRLKIEDKNEDVAATGKTDYNCITQHLKNDLKDNLTKFEDRLNTAHTFKNEEISLGVRRRATSEYQDTKQNRDYKNEWRMEKKNNCIRKGSIDSLKSSRSASTSNHILERSNSDYKKSDYRFKRSYSRSRSDYESSSSHHLWKRSSRTYRDEKYEDYKHNRYRNSRLRRSYESKENSRKMKYRNRESRGDSRDRSKYSSSDVEDRENSSYKKYESRRVKETPANILNDRKSHENDKVATEINFQASSSQTVVNTIIDSNAKKISEQHKANNESDITSTNLTKSTSTYIAINDSNNLEEGEILDSPEKENNSAKISEDKIEESNVKIPVEDKSSDIPINVPIHEKSISVQNTTVDTKKLEVNDHNYTQNPPVKISDLDVTPKSSVSSECCKIVPKTVISKELKVKEIVNVQSTGVKSTLCAVKNKKDQQNKEIVISRRRKAVTLSDSNASMTILMNIMKTCSNNNNYRDNDSTLKPRACKVSRASVKTACK